MKKMIIIVLSSLFFCNAVLARGAEQTVIGNRAGEVQLGEGPGEFLIEQRNCQYALTLGGGWHVRFNDPDVVFYLSKNRIAGNNLPYLSQVETQSGYAWSFTRPRSYKGIWFGVMCEDVGNFTWGASNGNPTPQLTQIFEENDRKCPGQLRDGRLIPKVSQSSSIFRELRGQNWSGFLMTSSYNKKSVGKNNVIRFCLMGGDNVILGEMEGGSSSLGIDSYFVKKIIEILSVVEFPDRKDAPI